MMQQNGLRTESQCIVVRICFRRSFLLASSFAASATRGAGVQSRELMDQASDANRQMRIRIILYEWRAIHIVPYMYAYRSEPSSSFLCWPNGGPREEEFSPEVPQIRFISGHPTAAGGHPVTFHFAIC